MIGQRIESRRGFPVGPLLLFLVAGLCIVVAVAFKNVHPAIFAILPAALGGAYLLVRERPFRADITADGLEIEDPPLSIAYVEIESVRISGSARTARTPITLLYTDGHLTIPARLNVHSGDLYEFLMEQLPVSGSRELPPVLANYCIAQEVRYGAEHVYSYRARQPRRNVRGGKASWLLYLGMALAGLLWIVAGAVVGTEGAAWIACGVLVVFFTGVAALLAGMVVAGRHLRKGSKAALVIGPEGLALVQGDMTGQMRWDELRDIRYRPKPKFFDGQPGGAAAFGIHLVVTGATIVIMDLYDRPLPMIHERLRAYWEGDSSYA